MVVQTSIVMITDDQQKFEGELTIAETEFLFTIEFLIPVDCHRYAIENGEIRDHRDVVVITIKRKGEIIPLSEDEFNFFFHLLVGTAFNMNDEWMDSPEEEREDNKEAESAGECKIELRHETLKILCRPKFDCLVLDDRKVPKRLIH